MARIRTIKPEFFTSSDVCALSPLARLLFIGLWGVADREGRMKWRPGDFKLQILPADACDIDSLCDEITRRGLVVLYGDGLAHIPTFLDHQSINPREQASKLPPPDACPTRADASIPDEHAQRGKEGKGKEGKIEESPPATSAHSARKARAEPRGTRLPENWMPSDEDRAFAADLGLDPVETAVEFRDFWASVPGARGRKLDWSATWRNRCRELGKRPRQPVRGEGETFDQRRIRQAEEAIRQ
jgi:hypothetical protein